mgnify:CR=1 FL=1
MFELSGVKKIEGNWLYVVPFAWFTSTIVPDFPTSELVTVKLIDVKLLLAII